MGFELRDLAQELNIRNRVTDTLLLSTKEYHNGKTAAVLQEHPRLMYKVDGVFENTLYALCAEQGGTDNRLDATIVELRDMNFVGFPYENILDEAIGGKSKRGMFAYDAAVKKLELASSFLNRNYFEKLCKTLNINVRLSGEKAFIC